RRGLARNEAEVGDERARGAAVSDGHGVALDRREPVCHPFLHLRVALPTGRDEVPLVEFARCKRYRVARFALRTRQAFPMPERDLVQSPIDPIGSSVEAERCAREFHGLSRARKGARYVIAAGEVAPIARKKIVEDFGTGNRLRSANRVERDVAAALEASFDV